jgi:hypothetical protein
VPLALGVGEGVAGAVAVVLALVPALAVVVAEGAGVAEGAVGQVTLRRREFCESASSTRPVAGL